MKPQFPTVQEQINYWNEIERLELDRVSRIQEAESRDATNETREVNWRAEAERLAKTLGNVRMALTLSFNGKKKALCEQYPELEKFRHEASMTLAHWSDIANPLPQAATTVKTLTEEEIEEREQATCDWYDENARKYRLVDEGQTWNGEGESFAERNA